MTWNYDQPGVKYDEPGYWYDSIAQVIAAAGEWIVRARRRGRR